MKTWVLSIFVDTETTFSVLVNFDEINIIKISKIVKCMYFAGDNDLSKELADTIDNSIVLKRLTDPNNFLAVKLKSGSENYTYFAQICILF